MQNLQSYFHQIDTSGDGKLDLDEFLSALLELKLDITQQDIVNLFLVFDHNKDNSIDYNEFYSTLRGSLSQFRGKLVEKAFQSVDINGQGQVDIRDLKKNYNARAHPVVVDGRMTEHQAMIEFCDSLDRHHPQAAGFIVTFDEFTDYYTNLSSVCDTDAQFQQLLTTTWSLNKPAAGEYIKQRPLSSYNQRQENHGNQVRQFGQESLENKTLTTSNRYYDDRKAPIRKSLAYSPPRKDGFPY